LTAYGLNATKTTIDNLFVSHNLTVRKADGTAGDIEAWTGVKSVQVANETKVGRIWAHTGDVGSVVAGPVLFGPFVVFPGSGNVVAQIRADTGNVNTVTTAGNLGAPSNLPGVPWLIYAPKGAVGNVAAAGRVGGFVGPGGALANGGVIEGKSVGVVT